MGVVNVTPDSFSDGGEAFGVEAGLRRALALVAAGADVLDIGGESTRPGATAVSTDEEIERVCPLIAALARETDRPISIDTRKPEVARAAVAAGARLWNDVNGLRGPGALATAAELGCDVVIMHMQGAPQTMQARPHYDDVVAEVAAFLTARAEAALAAGVAREAIWLDPGLGFGKTLAHNLALLAALPRFTSLGFPCLLGASRKRFIAAIDDADPEPRQRLGGSLAAALTAAEAGFAMVRVHDVAETRQALQVWAAIAQARGE